MAFEEYRETSTRVLQLLDEIFHTQSGAKKKMAQETRTSEGPGGKRA